MPSTISKSPKLLRVLASLHNRAKHRGEGDSLADTHIKMTIICNCHKWALESCNPSMRLSFSSGCSIVTAVVKNCWVLTEKHIIPHHYGVSQQEWMGGLYGEVEEIFTVQKVSIYATMQDISVNFTYNIRSGTDIQSSGVMHTSLQSKKRSSASTVCLSRRAPVVLSLHSTSNRGGQLSMSGCEACSQNYNSLIPQCSSWSLQQLQGHWLSLGALAETPLLCHFSPCT